tara:strand:- start:10804 stop:11451 length:648 start_codon:yes stop_codon:yes gene_type:complete
MKLFLTILILIISLSANATEWATYYVYFETEYIQGPWTRTDILEKSEYKYLAPKSFEDLFGSEDVDLINTMISRLKKNNPKVYDWTYDLTVQNDTVILTPKGQITQIETVKNEVTATLTLNNFKAVKFNFENGQETLTLNDLTLPFFDLVEVKKEIIPEVIPITKPDNLNSIENIQTSDKPTKENNSLTIWLVISCILNAGLLVLFILKRKNKST